MFKKSYLFFALCLLIIAGTFVFGCGQKRPGGGITSGREVAGLYETKQPESTDKEKDEDSMKDELMKLSSYEKLAVIKSINPDRNNITAYFLASEKMSVLNYGGGTRILSKYNNDITASQLTPGEVIEVSYVSGTQKVELLRQSPDAFTRAGETGVKIDAVESTVKAGATTYDFVDYSIVITQNGKEISINDLDPVDTVTLFGIGTNLYGIYVENGHGFVAFDNPKPFIGGLVEVGPRIVKEVTNALVIPVPEGTYTVRASKGETSGSTEISVLQKETVYVDLASLAGTPVQKGTLVVNIDTDTASLYVDGTRKPAGREIEVSYGRHTITVYDPENGSHSEVVTINSPYKEYSIKIKKAETNVAHETTTAKETETTKDN